MRNIQVTEYCRHIMELQVQEGDVCIDATVGNGHDTVHLAKLVGPDGIVHGFDIQQAAIDATMQRVADVGAGAQVHLHLESHENMDNYVDAGQASCIVFNFGYLPGGDHALATRAESSLVAVSKALKLLKKGGVLLLCIYSGGDSGFEERDALLEFARQLNPKEYLVMKTEYYNRANNPPIPVVIVKL